jgi:hypothetical protein
MHFNGEVNFARRQQQQQQRQQDMTSDRVSGMEWRHVGKIYCALMRWKKAQVDVRRFLVIMVIIIVFRGELLPAGNRCEKAAGLDSLARADVVFT